MNLDKTMQMVLGIVSARHGVATTALVGRAYLRRDRRAMWEAVWLYHEVTGARPLAVAHALGRNHSTATYALRQIAVAREVSPAYAADLDRLADEIAEATGAPGRAERALRAHFEAVDRGVSNRATKAVAQLVLLAQRDPDAADEILIRFEADVAEARSVRPVLCHGADDGAVSLAS